MVASPVSNLQKRQETPDALSRCLEDAIGRLSAEQIYAHSAHNFKQSGDRLRGGCPFHQTKSGSSFVVTISSKLFYCAGCNFGGSPADYRASLKAGHWVKARGRDFIEIVKELAADANVPFPERESSPEEIARAQKWERRRAVLAATQEYCQEALWSDTEAALEARHYLVAERGLTEEEIKLLPIGYYPSAGELKRYLISKGFSDEDWQGTGCVWKDMERYITFLWNDASGRPLTIYGRYFKQHPPEGKPKTIASPGAKTKQSPLYFDRALEARHKEIVLVEGVLDAVLLQAKGDIRVCAYVAASCSGDQIETLRRHRITRVTLCGDPDAGGENGTNSNLLRLIEAGISVYIAPKLPDGLDPDEFLLKYGMEGWKTHIDAAEHGFRWKARRLFESKDTSTDKGKAEVLQNAIVFCKAVNNHSDLDVFFWPVIRNSLGMEPEEFRVQLEKLWKSSPVVVAEFGGGSGSGGDGGDGDGGDGDGGSEEGFTEQNFWNAPVSWCGEIGWLFEKEVPVTEKDEQGNETPVIGEDGQPATEKVSTFVPKANFDFVVERELESEEGGGVVLLVKRSLDRVQKRVTISSQDYGSVKDFEAALKRVYKSGVVCNLKSEHLKSLIHVKLREYRARGGITYRLQDRVGQQADGHWVFKDCQITKDGVWSAEPNSDWIFSENLGGEDKMPQPRVAPPNKNALKRLVAAMRKFHGTEGIQPAMMALGFGGASVHYQTVMKIERRFPQVNFTGDPGTNKTVCAANGLSLVGWLNGDGLMSGVSESKLYECLKLTGSLPLCLDDPPKSRELDEILKRLYNAVPRMVRGNYQEPHAPLMVTSNHAIGDQQLATLTRMLQIPVYRQTDGDPSAWDEMQEAMEGASGCLPDLIKLGYPKAEIKQLEGELRSHLPKSHPRIASSMALILWYAMAVAKLADFDAESIKQYAITQLCPIANAADTNSDSITDFLDKLSALKSEALVGDWNCQVVETKTGKTLAIQMSQVFPMLDRQFNPVYSRKVLEALIAKSGGTLQSVQKFHSNRDESLAYHRAKLTAEVEPKEPEYKPKRCVLVPFHLIKGFTDDWKSPTPPDDPMGEPVTFPVTSVTPSYTQLHEKCNQQTVEPEPDSAIIDGLVTSFPEKSTKQNQQQVEEAITAVLGQEQDSHTLVLEKDVTEDNLEAVARIQVESERLHISCNQTVTGCNQEEKNVTELVEKKVDTMTTTPDDHPEAIAKRCEAQIAPMPLEQMNATSADESEEAIASHTPVEIAPEATEIVADEVAPQSELQLIYEDAPIPTVTDCKLYRVRSEYYDGKYFEDCTLVKRTEGEISSWTFRTQEGESIYVYDQSYFEEMS